jgi:hypothetical protein
MWFQCVGQDASKPTSVARDDPQPLSLQHSQRGHGPDLTQTFHRTARPLKPGRACPIHHIEIVVAGQRYHQLGQPGVELKAEKNRPIRQNDRHR